MNLMLKGYSDNDYDTCEKEKKHYPMIIKSGPPSLTTIPGGNVSGTSFTVGTITLNTSHLSNSCIKIDFTSNVFSTDFDETIIFQVFKNYNNLSFPVGPGWTFSSTTSLATTISFFVCDCDYCNNQYCTYTVVATIQ